MRKRIVRKVGVTLQPARESHFDLFKTIRKSVMIEHVLGQSLPWIESEEDAYHEELFSQKGLHSIEYKGVVIGFVGIEDREEYIYIGRMCIKKKMQNKGIGTAIAQTLINEVSGAKKTIKLDTLKTNPVRRLVERVGFVCVGEDEKMAYYEMLT